MAQRASARIDLGAVERNCARLKATLRESAELCAVVKADGYGHGADACASAALAGGASRLAVATAAEAEQYLKDFFAKVVSRASSGSDAMQQFINGTGNVLSFGVQSILPQNDSGIRAYGMVPRAHSAHVMRRHKENAASSGNWGFGLRNGAVPEVNDPVGLVSPQADFSGG